jgi:hypothetical protein
MVVLVVVALVLVAGGGAALGPLLRRQARLAGGGAGPGVSSGAARRGIDPFTIGDPWRRFVQEALRAQSHFDDVVGRTRAGPLRERLGEIGRGVERGVGEVWATARQGDVLRSARRRVDRPAIERRLDDARSLAQRSASLEPLSLDDTAARTVESLEGQLASAQRLDEVSARAEQHLRLLTAQLDEAVARAAELAAAAADVSALAGVGDDVDHVVEEMEALRLALEETNGAGPPG